MARRTTRTPVEGAPDRIAEKDALVNRLARWERPDNATAAAVVYREMLAAANAHRAREPHYMVPLQEVWSE